MGDLYTASVTGVQGLALNEHDPTLAAINKVDPDADFLAFDTTFYGAPEIAGAAVEPIIIWLGGDQADEEIAAELLRDGWDGDLTSARRQVRAVLDQVYARLDAEYPSPR